MWEVEMPVAHFPFLFSLVLTLSILWSGLPTATCPMHQGECNVYVMKSV